jgi:cell wall-associated NlpC family hydrolase/phage tail protein X
MNERTRMRILQGFRRRLMAAVLLMIFGAAAFGQNATVHRIQPGDTLARLCWQYRVRLDAVQAANPGVADPLTAGRQLVIPLAADKPMAVVAPRAEPSVRPATAVPVRLAMAVPMKAAIPVEPVAQPPPEAPSRRPPPPKEASASDAPPPPSTEAAKPSAIANVPPPAPTVSEPSRRLDFLGEARRLSARGLRYNGRWTPPGQRQAWAMDCSNTARYLYQAAGGIDIGRTASDQYYFLRLKRRAWDVPMGWDHKPRLDYLRKHLRAGDLLFWENTYKPVRKPDITHVMVFLGEDAQGRWQMAGSQTSRGVNIYQFDAQAPKGGYSSWFGLVRREGRFVAYGRPLGGVE